MREDHYEENNTRNFIPIPDPGRHSSADRERTAPSAPPRCTAVRWPQGLPAPARSHWRVGSIETTRLPEGTRCSIELYNISRPEAEQYCAALAEDGYRPAGDAAEAQDSGPDRSSAFVWTARREGASLELRFRDDRLLLLWNRPRPTYQFFCSLPEFAADAAVSTPATAAAASCR